MKNEFFFQCNLQIRESIFEKHVNLASIKKSRYGFVAFRSKKVKNILTIQNAHIILLSTDSIDLTNSEIRSGFFFWR